MVADALTKSLPSPTFISHRRVMMGQTPFALKFLHSYTCNVFILPSQLFFQELVISPN